MFIFGTGPKAQEVFNGKNDCGSVKKELIPGGSNIYQTGRCYTEMQSEVLCKYVGLAMNPRLRRSHSIELNSIYYTAECVM